MTPRDYLPGLTVIAALMLLAALAWLNHRELTVTCPPPNQGVNVYHREGGPLNA